MSRIYIRLLTVAAFVIAVTGASFSVLGLAKLFSGAPVAVAVMAGALEFAKLVTTGFLYRYWGHLHRPIRAYLVFAIVTLVGITSVGIFGFLSSAYQVSAVAMKDRQLKIDALTRENESIHVRIAEMRKFIDEIPASRISKKFEFQRSYEPEFKRLQGESDAIVSRMETEKAAMLREHVEIGPAIYLAQAVGTDIDTVVKWLILFFVSVFDPLAIVLVLCLNLAVRLREKYRGNESKIGAHAVTSPVDHRFSKQAKPNPRRAA